MNEDLESYFPPYVLPIPTGDELEDIIAELQAYRAWKAEDTKRRGDIEGQLTFMLSQEIAKQVDTDIVSTIIQMGTGAYNRTNKQAKKKKRK